MAIYDMATAIRGPNADGLIDGYRVGQQMAERRRLGTARSALARLAQGDQAALPELMQADPEAGMKWQDMQRAEETRKGLQGFFRPAQAELTMPAGSPIDNSLKALAGGFNLAPTIEQSRPASFDAIGATNFLASRGDTNALQELMKMQAGGNEPEAFGSVIWKGSQPFQLTKSGKLISLGDGFDVPTRTVDTGGQIVVMPTKGAPVAMARLDKGIDPTTAYAQTKQDQRLERGAELDVEVAASKKRAEAAVDREKDVAEQLRGADEAIADLTTLEGALSRLPSPAALKIESAKGFFGRGDPAVQEALGQASVISGRMLKYVERLPGAATDKDREVFMASAGVLTNEDLPVERRAAAARAAKDAYRRLINKYGKGNSGQPAQPSQQPAQQGIGKAALWLKSLNIKNQDDARKAVSELTRKGWSRQQIEQALDQAGL